MQYDLHFWLLYVVTIVGQLITVNVIGYIGNCPVI